MNVTFLYLTSGAGVCALLFALWKSAWINKQDAGTEKLQEIGAAVREGAMAFLTREYKVIGVFVIAAAGLLIIGNKGQLKWVAASFVVGAWPQPLICEPPMAPAPACKKHYRSLFQEGL